MRRPAYGLIAATVLAGTMAMAKEAPGIAVGTQAPEITGKTWVTADGKAPEMQGKVVLLDFWFAR